MKPSTALIALATVSLTACGADETEPVASDPAAITWHGHIAPLVEAHCAGCHTGEDSAAPFGFGDYDAVLEALPLMRASITEGRMPPWGITEGVTILGDLSLSTEQVAMFEAWAEDGAPEGDPAAPGPAIEIGSMPFAGADVAMRIAAPYAGQPGVLDEYRCFVLPWEEETETFITGMAVRPDNVGVVHHLVAFLVPPEGAEAFDAYDADDPEPGYTCYGQPYPSEVGPRSAAELPPSSLIRAWTPGMRDQGMGDGLGIRVPPGSRIVVQMHYYGLSDSGVPDQSGLEFSTAPTVERPSCVVPAIDLTWYFNPSTLVLPAGESGISRTFQMNPATGFGPVICQDVDWQAPLRIESVFPHQHKLGHRVEMTIVRADGTREPVFVAARYDFDWQRVYPLVDTVMVGPDDRYEVTCTWDNTAAARTAAGMDPTPADVNWGDDSDSEMCLVMVQLAPAKDTD